MASKHRSPVFIPLALALGAACLAGCGSEASPQDSGVTIHSFEVAPGQLQEAGDVTIRWMTSGADALALLRGDQEIDLGDREIAEDSITLLLTETTTFTLIARDTAEREVTASRTVVVDVAPGPRIAELIAPELVQADEAGEAPVTIAWAGVQRAAELRLRITGRAPIELDPSSAEGSLDFVLTEDTTFELVATNEGGAFSLEAEVRIAYLPVIDSFEVERGLVGFSETSAVHWATTGAAYVELWQDQVQIEDLGPAAGSREVAFVISSTLELRAFNELGARSTATVEVEVGAPRDLELQIDPGPLWLGDATTLSWQSQGGSELTLSLVDSGETLCEETEYKKIETSSCTWVPPAAGIYSLELSVSNFSGLATITAELYVSGGPMITHFDASPKILTAGDDLEIGWSVRGDPAGFEPILSLTDDRGNTYPATKLEDLLSTTLAEPGAYALRLEATTDHPRSTPASESIHLQVHPRPFVELAATPAYFDDSVDDEVTISWTTRDAETVALYRIADGIPELVLEALGADREAGSYRFVPRVAERYELVATNSIGGVTSQEQEVTVAPTEVITATAEPTTFTQGQQIRLRWEARMADEVRLGAATKHYLLEEIDAPYLDLERSGAHLPMTSTCGALETLSCASLTFPAGFTFPFGGESYDRVWVHTPGYLSFSTTGSHSPSTGANTSFPTPTDGASVSLAPFWDSLGWDVSRFPTGNVYYALVEEDGEDVLLIQWKDIGHSSSFWRASSFNFEVALRESGAFEFRYGSQSAGPTTIPADVLGGSSATIGFQLPDQSDFGVLLANDTIPMNGSRAWRTFSYRPLAALPTKGELVFAPYGAQTNFSISISAHRDGVAHSMPVNLEVARRPLVELESEAIAPTLRGEEFRLGWRTSNATALTVIDQEGTTRCDALDPAMVGEGFCMIAEDEAGTYSYTVRAAGANDAATERTVQVDFFGAFGVASFTAASDSVEKGGSVLLHWETFDADSLSLYADGVEIFSDLDRPSVGSFLVEELQRETEFKLVLLNELGVREEATLTVGLWAFTMDIQASATSVRPGDPITITAEARTLDGGVPLDVFGVLPMIDLRAPSRNDRYSSIAGLAHAQMHQIPPGEDATMFPIDLPLDFRFPYMGETYSQLLVALDGYVSLLPTAEALATNVDLPTAAGQGANLHLAPFWEDLHPRLIGQLHSARIHDDTFVIQWSRMSLTLGSNDANPQNLNFQLLLHRNGNFEYRYETMAPHPTYAIFGSTVCYPATCTNEVNGSAATIGYQFNGGSTGYRYHFGGTSPAPGNLPVPGGLSNRTLRYEAIGSSGSFTLHPESSESIPLCVIAGGIPVCKNFELPVEFELTTASLSKEQINLGESITISWESKGGKTLNIRDGGTVVHTTSDLATIDRGSVTLSPARGTTYVVELLAGERRETIEKIVEVDLFSITATHTPSSSPGAAVTVSWELSQFGPAQAFHVAAPMEQISNGGFEEFDLSSASRVTQLIGANADVTNATLTFVDFTFPYFGTEYSSIRVATDGYLSWDTSGSLGGNLPIPTTTSPYHTKVIAPFWEDLHTRQSGRVLAKKIDDDRYVIQWKQMSLRWGSATYEGNLNFLVVLHRDGRFEFHYGPMEGPPFPSTVPTDCYPASCENESNGSSATIGYQILGGSGGHQIHFGGNGRAPGQKPVAGGLSQRGWRFTPRVGASTGSAEVHPTDFTTYRICAFAPASGATNCAPTLGVEVPWGIDLFQVQPAAPAPGDPVTLSWSVQGADSLRILADDVLLLAHYQPGVPLLGSHTHTPTGATTYKIELTSLGRVVEVERVVIPRAFDLAVSGPSGSFFPGDTVVVDWTLTPQLPGSITMVTPMSEIPLGPGQEGAFVDISELPGASELELSETNGFAIVPLPFNFPYLGTVRTSAEVYVDGYVSFAGFLGGPGGVSNGKNIRLPSDDPSNSRVHMAVFWDDLVLLGGDSLWSYAPDADTLIIQWKRLSLVAGSSIADRYDLNFQVVLRSDGSFDYRYGKMAPPPPPFASNGCRPSDCSAEANGSSATIGYQSVDARFGSTLHTGSLREATNPGAVLAWIPDSFLPFPGGLSHRSFTYAPAPTGSSRLVVGRSGDHEICGIIGDFSECRSVRIDAVAGPGELMITEVMIDPAAGVSGQWFEVRNLTGRTIEMEGFELRSTQGSHRIAAPLPLPPRGFVTLASSAAVPFTPSYIYDGELPLHRQIDTLEVLAGTTAISSVRWGIAWNIPRGSSLSLDSSLHHSGAQELSDFSGWCNGGSGSPGALGAGCTNPWYEIDPLSDRPFLDIATTGARLYDVEGTNLIARVPTGSFQARLFGDSFSRVWVSSNGFVSLSDTKPIFTGAAPNLPRSEGQDPKGPIISTFWNLLGCGPGCRFLYELRQVAGEEVLVLQWDDFRIGGAGSISFQVQLWEQGDVVVAFDDVQNPYLPGTPAWAPYEGSTTWIGLEGLDPSVHLSAHYKRTIDLRGRSLLFQPK